MSVLLAALAPLLTHGIATLAGAAVYYYAIRPATPAPVTPVPAPPQPTIADQLLAAASPITQAFLAKAVAAVDNEIHSLFASKVQTFINTAAVAATPAPTVKP
jgi:hypothetical protein